MTSRMRNVGPCSVDGCEASSKKLGWCIRHYTRARRHGDPSIALRNVRDLQPCVVCGSDTRTIQSRFLCSKRCERLHLAYDGDVPRSRACTQCGVVVDLLALTPRGNRRKANGGLCDSCQKGSWRKECLSVTELAERDGATCAICDEAVDMSLRRKDSFMCPSIDHITPRSRGGSNAPDNLQLAHLACNVRKSNRMEVAS